MASRRFGPVGPTIRSVAEAAGVSVSTVSRVVREHSDVEDGTRARVLRVIGELGYRPSPIARALVSGHSPTLGLLVSDITNPFYPQLAKTIEQAARKSGYAVVICNTDDDPLETRQYVQMLTDLGVGGVIQASGGLDDESVIAQLGSWQRVVFANRRPTFERCHYVVSDNEAGSVALTVHLLEQGHRSIGFIAGPEHASTARERLSGFLKATGAAGSRCRAIVSPGNFTIESGHRAVRGWVQRSELPTAIIGVNDLVAVGALEEIVRDGLLVPEDVAVAGFDDTEFAASELIGLTSVRQHIDQMGREALQLLLRLVKGRRPAAPTHKVLLPELAVRRSTMLRRDAAPHGTP